MNQRTRSDNEPRASRRSPARRAAGFTLVELLVAVAIVGLLSAIAVANLSQSIQRSRQSRTMTNMRNLGVALQAYDADHSYLPADGITSEELVAHLTAGGLFENVDPNDGWGSPIVYDASDRQYTLESYGRDGADGPADISKATKLLFDHDLVLVDGTFIASPEN